ncbi:pleckstrin homology domain-containing family A member 1-like isoform X2 [Dreissena polymorpha]|uniref:pleckstrin homology domain-containing family A member 1-like isoform X2 n=1 Tax=Dreissena polymorpha TaxID=45954 RepID=UPI002265640E|nr:pleckstrin homology domain-containing family A member 1-like isoform X2 [Dreissena polymorpha]XP_052250336.1 pleckstrin homology domain-containing family A member 1-like isoform X2 [Dreissena polymorpha]
MADLATLCGVMKVEDQKGKFQEERYFQLNLAESKVCIYIDDPQHLPKTSNDPLLEIDFNVISKVSDARKLRPKGGNCFYITHSGDQMFIQASSEADMNKWIDALNEASKIRVSEAKHIELAPPNTRNEVAGGVIQRSTVESSDGGRDTPETQMPALSLQSIKSGYATKQGALRKNWKRRFFVLDETGFSYFKNEKERLPIKRIPLTDIRKAIPVINTHHHRQNLFEIVTEDRTYYVQCETPTECTEWIHTLNHCIDNMGQDSGFTNFNLQQQRFESPKSANRSCSHENPLSRGHKA